ncbi:MAG: YicC family protein [Chlorobi bacterium]|nr:MAG: YicC family protein [Bacteroidota bacterium]KXK35055.1 MAG: stress-induced protein [Chlorobi bacterium OLB6]MBE2265593.1 YicC family protein [Flavobacteriales bacterium]MBL1161708.1 YicC family protein [Chlorobiota bacterium]MBW7853931.1 YicC family protein [Candidatus Kapabacteria bacterium]MCC6331808.1 YicC family protein [Ignavibacteria bacterium]
MIKSMTGFGKAQGEVLGSTVTVEIKSVNGRYLEPSVRLPKEWAHIEQGIREVIRDRISRGSVNVFVRRESTLATDDVVVNIPAAEAYVVALQTIQNELNLPGTIGIEMVARYDAVFRGVADADADASKELLPLVSMAVDGLDVMRTNEGAILANDMAERLESITTMLTRAENLSAQRIPLERERLREKVRQLMNDEAVDEQRLQLEIVLLSEKLDVSEESVRLRSHIKHYRADLEKGGAVGRRLNFLVQEMNREVNTIGSKAADADIALLVVGMKEELERIREQVQNIE